MKREGGTSMATSRNTESLMWLGHESYAGQTLATPFRI